jgi:hypothetical protein
VENEAFLKDKINDFSYLEGFLERSWEDGKIGAFVLTSSSIFFKHPNFLISYLPMEKRCQSPMHIGFGHHRDLSRIL